MSESKKIIKGLVSQLNQRSVPYSRGSFSGNCLDSYERFLREQKEPRYTIDCGAIYFDGDRVFSGWSDEEIIKRLEELVGS